MVGRVGAVRAGLKHGTMPGAFEQERPTRAGPAPHYGRCAAPVFLALFAAAIGTFWFFKDDLR